MGCAASQSELFPQFALQTGPATAHHPTPQPHPGAYNQQPPPQPYPSAQRAGQVNQNQQETTFDPKCEFDNIIACIDNPQPSKLDNCGIEAIRFYLKPMRDQCVHLRDRPEYKLTVDVGNDVTFCVPPWFSKYPRDFKTGRPIPFIGGPDFNTKLNAGKVPWVELPLGVIKGDVCAENQDPNYNQREAKSPEAMQKKRNKISWQLTLSYMEYMPNLTVFKFSGYNVEERNLEHIATWAKNMERGWAKFTALVADSD